MHIYKRGAVLPEEITIEEMVSRIQGGERDLIGELWDRIHDFVWKLVNEMHDEDQEEDLEHECYLGLLDAVEHYDADQDVKFLTYAAKCLKGRMWVYLDRNSGRYVLPSYLLLKVRQYRRFVSEYQSRHGRKPSGHIIMAAHGWSPDEFANVLKHKNGVDVQSLDEPLTDDSEFTLGDTIQSSGDPAAEVEAAIFQDQLKRDLWGAVDRLPDQQARAIRMCFENQCTFKEIGEQLGVSTSTGHGICNKGLRRLRNDSRAHLRTYYVDLYGEGVKGGLNGFRTSGMSSTERAALKLMGEWWDGTEKA